MFIPRDVVFGLAAAAGFGTADFIARQVTHRVGFLGALFFLLERLRPAGYASLTMMLTGVALIVALTPGGAVSGAAYAV